MKKLDKKKIISLIKITQPFLMIDKIKNIKNLKSATGIKKINKNSWFFKCHFTNQPMMPGSLIQEAILQTIIATLYSNKKFKNRICLITSSQTNFYTKVDKPTILKIDIRILKITKYKIETTALVFNNKNIKIASGNYKYFISIKWKKKKLISKALVLKRKNNKVYLNYKDLNLNKISKKEVIVKVEYSSINYKDHLICSGKFPVNKNITVPGIDLSGKIFQSSSDKFKIGQKVVAIAAPLGVKCNGGYSRLVKINENYLDKMNKNLSTKKIMIFGTAGFTGIYTCLKIKKNYSKKKD